MKRKPEKADFAKWNRLPAKTLPENLETDFRDLRKFDTNLFETKTWVDFQEIKTWEITTAKNARLDWARNFAKTKTLICKTQNANLTDKIILKNQPKDLTQVLANGLRYLRWGGGRRSRPTGKMKRRRKLLEMCAESPASGARFVRLFLWFELDILSIT